MLWFPRRTGTWGSARRRGWAGGGCRCDPRVGARADRDVVDLELLRSDGRGADSVSSPTPRRAHWSMPPTRRRPAAAASRRSPGRPTSTRRRRRSSRSRRRTRHSRRLPHDDGGVDGAGRHTRSASPPSTPTGSAGSRRGSTASASRATSSTRWAPGSTTPRSSPSSHPMYIDRAGVAPAPRQLPPSLSTPSGRRASTSSSPRLRPAAREPAGWRGRRGWCRLARVPRPRRRRGSAGWGGGSTSSQISALTGRRPRRAADDARAAPIEANAPAESPRPGTATAVAR